VSTALSAALRSRDRGCTFPGCSRAHTSTRTTSPLDQWRRDEPREHDAACTHHHTLLHEGGFTIERDERGGFTFRRPDGRVIPRGG